MQKKIMVGGAVLLGVTGFLWAKSGMDTAEAANLFPYNDPEVVEVGARLYAQNCASCHGAQLAGAADWQSRNAEGRMPPPPHDETGHTWHHPDRQLFLLTKYGPAALVGDGYESDMPGFEGILSDDEIVQILSFIKSTWPASIIERHDAMNAAVATQQ